MPRPSKRRKLEEPRYPAPPLDLAKNEFRVLHLLPGTFEDNVCCGIEHHSLDSRPDYEALSYTWGDSANKNSITLNGSAHFPVTDNLFAALRRLRRQNDVRTMWIDAICIDQSDVEERNSQVAHMGHIYAHAKSLVVWLGDSDSEERGEPLPPYYTYPRSPSLDVQLSEFQALLFGTSTGDPLSCQPSDHALHSLHDALSQSHPSWADRAWVVQEYVRAPESTKFCFNCYEVQADDIIQWCQRIEGREDEGYPDAREASRLLKVILEFNRMRESTVSRRHLRVRLDLFEAVLYTLYKSCKDPRDKVFSLMSIVDIPSGMGNHILPNYSLGVARVFASATYHIILSTHELSVLRLATHNNEGPLLDSLPTWSADFRSRADTDDFPGWTGIRPSWGENGNPMPVLSFGLDHASEYAHVTASSDLRRLHLLGTALDQVIEVAQIPSHAWFNMHDALEDSTCARLSRDVSTMLLNILPTGLYSYFNTEVDIEKYKSRVRHYFKPSQQIFSMNSLLRTVHHLWDSLNASPFLRESYRSLLDADKLLSWSGYASNEMTLFATQDGLLGIGSSSVKSGDTLALLYGSPACTVL